MYNQVLLLFINQITLFNFFLHFPFQFNYLDIARTAMDLKCSNMKKKHLSFISLLPTPTFKRSKILFLMIFSLNLMKTSLTTFFLTHRA